MAASDSALRSYRTAEGGGRLVQLVPYHAQEVAFLSATMLAQSPLPFLCACHASVDLALTLIAHFSAVYGHAPKEQVNEPRLQHGKDVLHVLHFRYHPLRDGHLQPLDSLCKRGEKARLACCRWRTSEIPQVFPLLPFLRGHTLLIIVENIGGRERERDRERERQRYIHIYVYILPYIGWRTNCLYPIRALPGPSSEPLGQGC